MSEKYSPAFQEALDIIRQRPLPDDAEERLIALEDKIRPDEADRFGDLWESFITARDFKPR